MESEGFGTYPEAFHPPYIPPSHEFEYYLSSTSRTFIVSSYSYFTDKLVSNYKLFRSYYMRRPPQPPLFGWYSLLTYLLTYLLTPWCRVLLEKLTGLQLVKKSPAFHGTPRFITALTSVRQLSLSWASPIQSIYPHPTSWRSILILSTHLRLDLPIGIFPSGFPTKTLYTPSPHPYAPHAQPISFFSILSPAQYWVRSTNHLAPRYAISFIPPLLRPS